MPLRPAAVLFDLDGTLIDTAPDFVATLNRQLQAESRPTLPADRIRVMVSQGARAVVSVGFSDLPVDSEAFEAKRQAFLDDYLEHVADESRLFPGLDNLLAQLEARQIPWGIVTNKPSRFTTPLLQALQLDKRCAVAICPDMVTHTKPHAEPMFKACEAIGVAASDCIYVGDHLRDIEAGRNAGMITVAAAWGYVLDGESADDWKADYTLSSAEELAQLLGLEPSA